MARITVDVLVEQAGLSIAELARRCGLEEKRIQAITEGRWLPSPRERSRLSAALQRDVDDIDWGHTISPRNVRYHRFGLPDDFSSDRQP